MHRQLQRKVNRLLRDLCLGNGAAETKHGLRVREGIWIHFLVHFPGLLLPLSWVSESAHSCLQPLLDSSLCSLAEFHAFHLHLQVISCDSPVGS